MEPTQTCQEALTAEILDHLREVKPRLQSLVPWPKAKKL